MLKLRRLTAATATASLGSASQAARALHTTQPAVTASIAALESELGTPLFTRTAQGMTLSAAGHPFIAHVETAFAVIDTFGAALSGSGAPLHRRISETQLQAFLALNETGSHGGAARRLGVSQPAISRSVRDLEIVLGATLWRRTGTSGEPTSEGRALARATGVFSREIELAVESLREHQGRIDGVIRIGALPLSRSDWVPDAVMATLRQFPGAHISLVDGPYSEQIAALRHGRIDMIVGALRDEGEATADIDQTALFDDALSIAVRSDHPVLSHGVSPAWLAAQAWVLPARGTPGRDRFLAYLATQGLAEPGKVVECGSLVATRALLRGSDLAAPLSRRQIRLELERGLLALAAMDLPGTVRPIGVTVRRGFRPTRLYTGFLDALSEGAQQL